jgi:hypothetical protein
MQFDGTNITYLTPSFFPFVNHDLTGVSGLNTVTPGLAMTPRQICISAKGFVNSTNNPASGPDTPASQINLYTVLTHPAPVPAVRPQLAITTSEGNAIVSWPYDLVDYGFWTLQSSPSVSPSSWSTVGNVVVAGNTAYSTNAIAAGNKYFRLARW